MPPQQRRSFFSWLTGSQTVATTAPPQAPMNVLNCAPVSFPNTYNARRGLSQSQPTDPMLLAEDPAANPDERAELASKEGKPEPTIPELQLTISPEYSTISTEETPQLFAHVNLQFPAVQTESSGAAAMDVVCILDNSGSMDGSKIESVRAAMQFVVSVLGDNDRLSVVTFNSCARIVHGLKRMNAATKQVSLAQIERVTAGGGTDIYDGMSVGWSVLENRTSRSPASCVFLLTDGQDKSRLEEKKNLARKIRAAGSSFFLFGFGADHDSEHLHAIANAAESSFIYVAQDDQVVDAFGGAIGTQQGAILRDVTVQIFPEGARLLEVRAGKYSHTLSPAGDSATVRFTDLYSGEQRDFLVSLRVAGVDRPVEKCTILRGAVQFRIQGEQATRSTPESLCSVTRVAGDVLAKFERVRHSGVEREVLRLLTTQSLEEALRKADAGDIAGARLLLQTTRGKLLESNLYMSNDTVVTELARELQDALNSLQSREEYERRGGRHGMQESLTNYSMQRAAWNSKSSNAYQNASSVSCQSKAKASKKTIF